MDLHNMNSPRTQRAFLALLLCLLLSLQLPQPVFAATSIPGIPQNELPQMIIFTHDDDTTSRTQAYVTSITNKFRNPNNCTVKAAFYTTAVYSNCTAVKRLYDAGHEIAEHTQNHKDLHTLSAAEKKTEILGGRDFLTQTCKIPVEDVVGHRSPYLSSDPDVRKILNDAGYLYDTSIPEQFPSKSSPSAESRLFPYRLDDGIVQTCTTYGNINHCTATETYPGLWEIPLWQYQKGPYQGSTPDLMDPPKAYEVLKAEFDRNYNNSRTPIGIWTHTSTNYLNIKENRDQISKFLEYAMKFPDVWVVTPRQLVDFMQAPVRASEMKAFMSKYTRGCSAAAAFAPSAATFLAAADGAPATEPAIVHFLG